MTTFPHGGAAGVFRSFENKGDHTSGLHEPLKEEIRDLLRIYEGQLTALMGASVVGTVFASIADGMAGTEEGQIFVVLEPDSSDAVWTAYKNDGVTATPQRNFPDPRRIEEAVADAEAARDAAQVSESKAAGHEQGAEDAEAGAKAARDTAELAALAVGAQIYADIAAGLADTADGDLFMVFEPGGAQVYRNDTGSATYLGALAHTSALEAIGWKERASEPVHADYKMRVGGVWWSPDWYVMAWAGQSGVGENSGQTSGDKTPDANVYALDNTTGLLGVATLGQEPFSTHAGAPNSLALHAAKRISRQLRRPVAIVNEPVGGSEFGTWRESLGGANWATLVAAITSLFADASGALWGQDKVHAFGWNHGEAFNDFGPLHLVSEEYLPELCSQVFGASWADDDLRFVAGEVMREESGGTAARVNRELRRFAEAGQYPRFKLVGSHGLDVLPDGVHAEGHALVEYGARYADAFAGLSEGLKSASLDHLAVLPEHRVINEQLYSLLIEMTDAPTDASAQNITILTARENTNVVFEVNGVDNHVMSGATNATFTLSTPDRAVTRVWYPAVAMADEPPSFTRSSPEKPGTMEQYHIGKHACVAGFFISHHANLTHAVKACEFGDTCETVRIQSCPKVDFREFRAAELPETVNLINFAGSLVPPEVQDELATVNEARGYAINLANRGTKSAGRAVLPFGSITNLTESIQSGFAALNNSVAIVVDQPTGSFRVLYAEEGAPVTPGIAPAGWRYASPAASQQGQELPSNFLDGVSDGEAVYLKNNTINGEEGKFPNGVTLGDGAEFATRQEAVDAIALGWRLADGKCFSAAGCRYMFKAGALAIPDMPGVIPVAPATPEHFAAVGNKVVDDTAAFRALGVFGGIIKFTSGKTYLANEVQFAKGSTITTNGAVLHTDGANAPAIYEAAHILFREGCTIKDKMKVTASGMASGANLVHCFEECDVEFDLRADTELTATALVMQGEKSNLRSLTTRNFARPVQLDGTLNGNVFATEWDADETATESVAQLGSITTGLFTKTADFSFKLEFDVPASAPAGCIAEMGSSTLGFYVGFTSGELVVRVGSGALGHPATAAKVTFPEHGLLDKAITLYGAVDVSTDKLTVWAFEEQGSEVFTLSDVAASPFTSWAGSGGGKVGSVSADGVTGGEDASDYNGTISGAFFWDSSLQDGEPNYAEGFQSGGHDLRGFSRGWSIRQQRNFTIGAGRIYQRSAQAAANGEVPGYNGFLLDGAEGGNFGDQYIAEAGEHAIRIAGPRSSSLTWGVPTMVRASGSSFKVNGSTNLRSRDIFVAGMHIVDPCWETGPSGKASQPIRVSHTDGFTCGPVSIMETGDYELTRGTLTAFSNSTGCSIESVNSNMDWPLTLLTDQEDLNGDTIVGNHEISIQNAQCSEPKSDEEIVTFDMREDGGTIGGIRIDLNILGVRPMSRSIVKVTNAVAGFDGPIILTGTMSKFAASDIVDLQGQNLSCDFLVHGSGAGSRILVTPQEFDPSKADDTASLFIRDFNGAVGAGNAGASVVLSRIGGGRPGAGIVAGQQGADADQVSLEVWVHSAGGSSNELTLHSRFRHNGAFEMLGANASVQIGGKQVLGPRLPNIGDLAVSASSGTLPTVDETMSVSDAAAPTNVELLKFCMELAAKVDALTQIDRDHGLIG